MRVTRGIDAFSIVQRRSRPGSHASGVHGRHGQVEVLGHWEQEAAEGVYCEVTAGTVHDSRPDCDSKGGDGRGEEGVAGDAVKGRVVGRLLVELRAPRRKQWM